MQPDAVFFNGKVYTLDPARPRARAIAVRCGYILAVGEDAEVLALAGPGTPRMDLGNRMVLPGFCDAHIHLVGYGLSLTQVQLDGIASLDGAVRRVAERAQKERPGAWMRGMGWNRNLWPGAPFPHRWDLDPVTPDNPVFLPSKDGHSAWANSLALRLAGITASTPDPSGGQIERDAQTGEPTGLLKEGPAMEILERAAGPVSPGEQDDAVRAAAKRLHRLGITSVHAMLEEHDLVAVQRLWERRELGLHVQAIISERCLDSVRKVGLRAGLGDEWLRVFALKVFADGALGSRSADMLEPYDDEPDNRGIEVTNSERLDRLVADCSAAGWNMAIHAIGDRANQRVLDALEAHHDEWSRQGLRPRIEHAQLLAPADVPRLGRLGVVASMQPIHCTSDYVMANRHWGKRCAGAYAWRSILETGAPLAFGSDAPVEEPDVLRGIHAAVTRQRADGTPRGGWHSEQCLSVAQAVHAYTLGPAYACGLERVQGSLEMGKQADMVVLSQDLLELPPQAILDTRVVGTVAGGELVFSTL